MVHLVFFQDVCASAEMYVQTVLWDENAAKMM